MNALFKINNFFYNYWIHIPLFIILMFMFKTSLAFWVQTGLLIYVLLMVIRLWTEGSPLWVIKELGWKKGLLSFLVGFNLCLVLGPISILLFIFLRCNDNRK